jgi:predicted permease
MQLSTILITAINAIAPIVLMIALGYFLRQKGMLSDTFLKNGNKLVFKLCLPSMLFVNVYNVPSLADIHWDIVLYGSVALCIIFILGIVIALTTTPNIRRRGVVAQCAFRSNFAIIGLPLAAALGGPEAEAVAAVMSSVTVPLINVLAVISLSMFVQEGGKISVKHILLDIVKNPLIQGVALGMLCLVLRLAQTKIWGEVIFSLNQQTIFLYTVLTWLKNITTPLALLVLGGQFVFSAVKELKKEIIISTACRLVLAPAIGITGAYLMNRNGLINCGPAEYPALVALFASPVAVSSAIMATEMKNDEQLATQLVVWTTLFSALTVFLIVCILMALGLIAM